MPGCVHLMAVRMAAGLKIHNKTRNLSIIRRKCIRAGRRQGRKRGLDHVELYAPDSVRAERKKVSVVIAAAYTCEGVASIIQTCYPKKFVFSF